MLSSFELNMPSIPGQKIKFKIQDIRPRAFGSQRNRFLQDKSQLTQKFIGSFTNFHAKPQQTPTQASQSQPQSHPYPQKIKFRMIVPQQKKHLFDPKPPSAALMRIKPVRSTLHGYTFYKAPRQTKQKLNEEVFAQQITQIAEPDPSEMKVKENRLKPSHAFVSQTRKRLYTRMQKQKAVPGPGHYNYTNANSRVKKTKNRSARNKSTKDIDLRGMIASIVENEQSITQNQPTKTLYKQDHMFVADDRDRFGQQMYPMTVKREKPGPGTYQIGGTIEEKVNKVILVQEQRKLLMQWFKS